MTYIVIIITERNNPIIIIDIVRVLFSDFSFLFSCRERYGHFALTKMLSCTNILLDLSLKSDLFIRFVYHRMCKLL